MVYCHDRYGLWGSPTLVEDYMLKDSLGMLEILAFSKVVFIPRSAVLNTG